MLQESLMKLYAEVRRELRVPHAAKCTGNPTNGSGHQKSGSLGEKVALRDSLRQSSAWRKSSEA